MEYKLSALLLSALTITLGSAVDANDILSNILNNAGDQNLNKGNKNDGGVLLNLNPSAGSNTGAYGGLYGNFDDNLVDDYRIPTVPVFYEQEEERSVSSLADLVNVVFGLGGHIVGRAGWVVRDALGALAKGGFLSKKLFPFGRLGKFRKLFASKKFFKGGLFNKRDGMLYSNHRLSDNNFGLRNRALGGLRDYGMYRSYPNSYARFQSHGHKYDD